MLTPNELVFTFWGSYVCANFGENRSRNATVRVPVLTDTQCWRAQTGFIISPMLYASPIAMGQKSNVDWQRGPCSIKMWGPLLYEYPPPIAFTRHAQAEGY